nr:hypothetical protein [Tanacetum cinerariifolium]
MTSIKFLGLKSPFQCSILMMRWRIKKKSMIVCWPPRMLRGEDGKLLALNEVIADALDEIKTQENNVEILDGTGDDV